MLFRCVTSMTMSVVQEPQSSRLRVLYIEGPLRFPVSAELRSRVRALLRRGERRIVLNLARVSSIDAAGIGELVRVYNITAATNGSLRIAEPTPWVRYVLQLVGLLDLLSVDSNVH